jgi:osmotically-inducible protein OsmY
MKFLFILAVGIAIGVFGWRSYERTQHPTMVQRSSDLAARTKETAIEARDVATEKAKEAGAEASDVRIIAVIKGKFLVDKDLSVFAIAVDCKDGKVMLSGSAASPELINHAIKLAQETSGVRIVNSTLTVKN